MHKITFIYLLIINITVYLCELALVGGTVNNGSKCGRYVNVNNVPSAGGWGVGASHCLLCMHSLMTVYGQIKVYIGLR